MSQNNALEHVSNGTILRSLIGVNVSSKKRKIGYFFLPMKNKLNTEEQRLLACVNYAIKHDPFPISQIEGLARRIANHTPCTSEMVNEYLHDERTLGHFEREVFESLVSAFEKNTGKKIPFA